MSHSSLAAAVAAPSHPLDRKFLPLTFLLILGMYLLLQNPYWVPCGDGEFYVAAAWNLATGRGYRFNGLPIGSAPPGWPAMMAVVMKMTPYFLPLKLLAMSCMIGSLMLAYRVVRRFVAPPQAFGLILLTAILSHVYQATYWLISESSFCLATAASILIAMQISETPLTRRRDKWRVAFLLSLCAAAVSIRQAGLLNMLLVVAALLDGQWKPRRSTVWIAAALVLVVTTGTFFGWRIGQRLTLEELADRTGVNIALPDENAFEGLPSIINGAADQTAHAYPLFPPGNAEGVGGAGGVADKFLNWGHWFSFLYWQPLRAGAGSWKIATISSLLGWALIALLSVLVITATKRRRWIWLGAGLYSAALAMRWSVVNARYYVPVAFLITLGIVLATRELLQWARVRATGSAGSAGSGAIRRRALPIAIHTLFALFVGAVLLCNIATYAVEVSIARDERFYQRYDAGMDRSMIAACQYLNSLPPARRPRDREISVSQRYTNLGRSRPMPTALRQAVMLTGRSIITPPFKSTAISPAAPTGKGLAIRRWLGSRGVRYYLWQPPISPWRVWHFRMPWLEQARTRHTADSPYASDWQLFRLNADLTVTQLPLPQQCDPVTRVPALAVAPIINEFLASNARTNRDEDGDSSDWIEIYNPGSTRISLNGYYLTDSSRKLTRWKFPNVSLAGNGYLLVWASGKNRTDPAKPLHSNFKLSEPGEYLGLVAPDGVTITSDFGVRFPAQRTDISYGVPPGGGPDHDLIPTPAAPNKLAPSLVAQVQFDHDRGLYTAPFNLALSTATNGASIRYTTDGSMPTPTAGTLYTDPILINNTTVVHAIGYKAGSAPTAVLGETYIFPAMVLQQPENIPGYPNPPEPINNPGRHEIDVPLTYGMDPNIVNDPQYAQQALQGLSQIPTLSIGVNPNHIFGSRGFYDTPRDKKAPRIPISFEFIDPNNPRNNVGVGAGISGHGDQSLKRSLHIHFSNKYGPAKLKAPIFDSAPFSGGGGSSATNEFTDLILRAGNHRSWANMSAPSRTTYTEDEYVRDTQIAMTGQGTHGMFVHVYINGIYWGLYNLVERPDEGYGEAYFNAKKADYFSIANNHGKSGDATRWNYLMDTLCRQDMSVPANYAQMQKYLNVKQFADYLIGQWFCGVSDWPANNYWAGGDTSRNQPFQFYAWDGEFMMTTVDRFPKVPHGPWVNPAFRNDPGNSLYRGIAVSEAPIMKLWRALKRNPDFMAMFADEVSRNIANDGPLSDANALARWNALNDSIRSAIVAESARWGDALASTGRHTYTKNGDWINAIQTIANDLRGADARFVAALRAEGYYP